MVQYMFIEFPYVIKIYNMENNLIIEAITYTFIHPFYHNKLFLIYVMNDLL